MLKDNKGMSLTTTVMTVLVIIIILSTLGYTSYANLKIRKLNNLYTDIRTLSDEVAIYYLQNGTLPVSGETITLAERRNCFF